MLPRKETENVYSRQSFALILQKLKSENMHPRLQNKKCLGPKPVASIHRKPSPRCGFRRKQESINRRGGSIRRRCERQRHSEIVTVLKSGFVDVIAVMRSQSANTI